VLDATIFDNRGVPNPQGFFYRVVNVDDSVPNQVQLELQTPLNFRGSTRLTANAATEPRVIVVLENVIEVFTKGVISNVSPPADARPDDLQSDVTP
jgi:hypothetical protein